jgi:hypothetical protein
MELIDDCLVLWSPFYYSTLSPFSYSTKGVTLVFNCIDKTSITDYKTRLNVISVACTKSRIQLYLQKVTRYVIPSLKRPVPIMGLRFIIMNQQSES